MKTSRKERVLPSIDDVKARTSMVVLVGHNVALKKAGREHFGLCPFHNEKTPSFTVSETKGFYHCFGCGAHGDAFDYLRLAHGMQLPEAIEYLAIEAGMLSDREGRRRPTRQPMRPPAAHSKAPPQDNPRQSLALDIWNKSQPAAGTPVEAYLRHRGISISVPPSIRYNFGVRYERSSLLLPCMVAAVQAPDRSITGIHRTFLRDDGQGKAGVAEPKMALGPIGRGAVRLGPAGPVLGVAEGIETGLSAMQLFEIAVWCAIGSRLDRIALPEEVQRVIIFADSGEAGMEAASKALDTFNEQGRQTKICAPGLGDFNDVLVRESAA